MKILIIFLLGFWPTHGFENESGEDTGLNLNDASGNFTLADAYYSRSSHPKYVEPTCSCETQNSDTEYLDLISTLYDNLYEKIIDEIIEEFQASLDGLDKILSSIERGMGNLEKNQNLLENLDGETEKLLREIGKIVDQFPKQQEDNVNEIIKGLAF